MMFSYNMLNPRPYIEWNSIIIQIRLWILSYSLGTFKPTSQRSPHVLLLPCLSKHKRQFIVIGEQLVEEAICCWMSLRKEKKQTWVSYYVKLNKINNIYVTVKTSTYPDSIQLSNNSFSATIHFASSFHLTPLHEVSRILAIAWNARFNIFIPQSITLVA